MKITETKTDSQWTTQSSAHLSNERLGDAHFHRYKLSKTSSLWERLSVSTVPYRLQLLYGLLLELRSLYHRIRLLVLRKGMSLPQMGRVFQLDDDGCLVPNSRTQAHTMDMQQLRERHPWLSPEDWNLFLIGWDAGWESSKRSGIPESSALPHKVP
jgi:hypothetical protein